MDIETIKITPKDNVGKKLKEAKELSDFNNMPVLIKLFDCNGKCGRKDRAYLVSGDYYAEIIARIYKTKSGDSASFSDDEKTNEQNDSDFNRLKNIINNLYEKSSGGEISIGPINNPKIVNVEIGLFPAIDSKSSVSETIYAYESGQLDDIDVKDWNTLDNEYYTHLRLNQVSFKPELMPNAEKQRDEYKSTKIGKYSLRRIALMEKRLTVDPMYNEGHFEKLIGNYRGLLSRRINGRDRYIYGVFDGQPPRIIVHSVRGHYD